LKAIQHDELFGQGRKFDELVNPIWKGNDFYCVAHDFPAYLDAQNRVDECFRNPRQWAKKSIMTGTHKTFGYFYTSCNCNGTITTRLCFSVPVAGMGKFSSDRTIKEYAEDIWNIKPVALHDPITNYHN
jgi:starch phosphorylase